MIVFGFGSDDIKLCLINIVIYVKVEYFDILFFEFYGRLIDVIR